MNPPPLPDPSNDPAEAWLILHALLVFAFLKERGDVEGAYDVVNDEVQSRVDLLRDKHGFRTPAADDIVAAMLKMMDRGDQETRALFAGAVAEVF